MRKKLLLFLACLFISIGIANAQSSTIRGTVYDDSGEALVGASVAVSGTTVGVITNVNGEFTLRVPASAKTLKVSYVGMETQTVTIVRGKAMRIVLKSSSKQLDELVVVGYGSARKVGTVVGSVTTVNADKIKSTPAASTLDALQGQVSGMQVLSTSGAAGDNAVSITIHGTGSLGASSTPLYVIDGIPSSSRTIMAMSPGDIQSVTVLKDASATSIYGSRAANGVIFVTTKNGKFNSKATVTVKGQYGWSTLADKSLYEDMMSGTEWKDFIVNSGLRTADWVKSNYTDQGYDANTRWYNYFQQFNNPQSQTEVSVEGGGDKVSYFMGASQFHQRSTAPGNWYNRYTVRSNVDARPLEWLKTGMNINLGLDKRQKNANWGDSEGVSNYTSGGLSFLLNPLYPAVDENGKEYPDFIPGLKRYNPHYYMANNPDQYDRYSLVGNAYIEIDPIKNLKILSRVGTDFSITLDNWKSNPSYAANNGSGTRGKSTGKNYSNTITNTIEYKFSVNDLHNFTLLGGQEGVINQYDYYYAQSTGQTDDRLLNLQNGKQSSYSMSESTSKSKFLSFFGRVDYNFAEKYFLDASIRNDACSRFGKDNRNATFWAAGAMWKITKEDFMKDVKWVNDLSVKLSYGTQGNAGIGDYSSLALLGTGTDYATNASWLYTQPENRILTWEKQKLLTLTLAGRVLDMIDFDIEYYNRKTSNMLMDVPYPYTTGFSSVTNNVGELQNQGLDITLGVNILKSKDYYLNFNTTFNYNSQKITKLFQGRDRWEIANTLVAYKVGKPVMFYCPIYAGVNKENGHNTWYVPGTDKDSKTTSEVTENYDESSLTQNTGKKRFAPITGGFGFTGGWKGLSIAVDFAYVLGKYLVNNDAYFYKNGYVMGKNNKMNQLKEVADYWTKDNTNAKYPDWSNGETMQFDTHLLENASFLRLKNLQVGYDLPASILGFQNVVKGVKLTFTGRNLLTATHYGGIDPEVDSNLTYGYPW
jgi:TonB-linked SusC/RagA family outer membrane protein